MESLTGFLVVRVSLYSHVVLKVIASNLKKLAANLNNSGKNYGCFLFITAGVQRTLSCLKCRFKALDRLLAMLCIVLETILAVCQLLTLSLYGCNDLIVDHEILGINRFFRIVLKNLLFFLVDSVIVVFLKLVVNLKLGLLVSHSLFRERILGGLANLFGWLFGRLCRDLLNLGLFYLSLINFGLFGFDLLNLSGSFVLRSIQWRIFSRIRRRLDNLFCYLCLGLSGYNRFLHFLIVGLLNRQILFLVCHQLPPFSFFI